MNRILVAALVAAMGLTVAAAASAAQPLQFLDVIDETDADFCGTGETVEIEGTVRTTIWTGTTGGDPTQDLRVVVNIHITYTNPASGAAVVERWSFMGTNEIVSGLESGVHTHEFTENGLKATFRLAGGGLLSRDAGSLTYRVTFDANDVVTGFELVTMHGPHPAFSAEGDYFCDTLVAALGLD